VLPGGDGAGLVVGVGSQDGGIERPPKWEGSMY